MDSEKEFSVDMAQLPPLSPQPPQRSDSGLSPAKRSVTVNSGAVIRSPMAMANSQSYNGVTNSINPTSLGRTGDDASPLSTTTAAEYAEIEQKQLELRSVVEHRILTLERSLQKREEELEVLRAQLRKTEEDYQFNYDLIKDRDSALEEAATQLQSLYDELKRHKSNEVITSKRLEGLEQETHQLRQRLRETEVQREETVQRVQQAYQLKEKQLKETFNRKETVLESEKQRLHEEYLRRFKTLDDARAELMEKSELLKVELENKWKYQVQRLEKELSTSVEAVENIQREKVASEARYIEKSQELSVLKNEYELFQQRHQDAMSEAIEKQQKFEAKLKECSVIMGQGMATAEDSIRQQANRATKLEIECGQLQSQVTELQERLQAMRLQRDEDAKRFMDETREAQERYRQAASQVEEQRRAWAEAERQITSRCQRLESELEASQKEAEAARRLATDWQQRHEKRAEELLQCELEVGRVRREVQRCREEEQRTSAQAQETQRAAEEKVKAAARELEAAREEAAVTQRRQWEAQERAQAEAAKLTRELHASEAARHALEEHLQLAEDGKGQRALVEGLRRDKEELERKVMELERTNAAIREQVASFTIELQNDPAVKSARETQRRVQELQEDLLRAREDNQRLRDVLREKEEEVSRYQLEILRARATESATGHLRNQEDQRLREEYQSAKESYERMRQSLKDQQQKEKKRRTSSNKLLKHGEEEKEEEDNNNNNNNNATDEKDAKDRQNRFKASDNILEHDTVMMREAELWRRKYLQLEQNVRGLLRERDNLTRELNLSRQDVDALTSEKQSLVDLNSLLKAQMREAYRTALEYPQLPPPTQQQQQHVNISNPVDLSMRNSRISVQESSRSTPQLAIDNVFTNAKNPHSSADAERLAALEEELAEMKVHMLMHPQGAAIRASQNNDNNTTSLRGGIKRAFQGVVKKPLKQQQKQRQSTSPSPISRPASKGNEPLVRRGSTAVRHYGYL